jgi:hypothetical protein
MRTNLLRENPIELFRFKQDMTQKQFAEQLGYRDKSNYQQHMKYCSQDIIKRIIEAYGVDLSYAIIKHLRYELSKQTSKKPSRRRLVKTSYPIDDNLNIFDELLEGGV